MFVDESLAPVEFKSQWKKERYVRDSDTQTKELSTAEAASQSIKRKHREVQTDSDENKEFEVVDDETPELHDFLKTAEEILIEELKKTINSHAFDGYDVTWEEERDTVTVLHTLNYAESNGQMQITGLDWNATGSTICASYGRFDHEDWCTHRSALCTWNIDRRGLNTEKPDTVIDIPTCLMCIACHPQNPSMIAGGTFNGEVLVWDLSREDDMLIASSGIGDDSHREPVSKVHWAKDPESKSRKYNVVSVSGDGKILVWKMHKHKQQLKLTDGFILLTESLPRWMQVRSKHGGQEMGVTCLSYNPNDSTTFLVGSESGAICRCSTETRGTTATGVTSSVPLQSPVTLTFTPHHGPVYSVACSPFHRNVFLSCSTDTSARIYTLLQTDPMITTEPGAGYLYSATWSPVRPLVFAVGTEDSQLLIYDLKYSTGVPKYKLESSPTKKPVYAVQFNPKQEKLLATGDGVGSILIWQLNGHLTQQGSHEVEILDDIAKTALE